MDTFTPAQRNAIQAWTAQRDALLREIGLASEELNTTRAADTAAGLALADKHKQVAEAEGRISVLVQLEERTRTSVPMDIAELEARKTRLTDDCVALDAKLASGGERYVLITGVTAELEHAHDIMRDQAAIVNKVTGELVELSTTHLSDAKEIMSDIRAISNTVIDRANENLVQTKIVIEKMPKVIFDMQRPIPVRRTYPVDHPNYVAPGDAINATP